MSRMADRGGVHLLLQEPVISQLYVITGYSIPQFTAIRRILVSNLVSNAEPPLHVPPHPLGIPYIALTCDWVLGIVNQQH